MLHCMRHKIPISPFKIGIHGRITWPDPGFIDRGGAKDYAHATRIPSAEHEVPYGRGPGSA